MKKVLITLFFFCVGFVFFWIATWRLNDGFSIHKIQSDLSYSPKREVISPSNDTVHELLSQNFYYLGKGSQCYVFESEDKDLVLKFFRYPRYRLPKLAKALSLPPFLEEIQNKRETEKQQKLEKLFRSCKIAYEELHHETGLLYLHLNKTDHLKQRVVIYDKLKRAYPIEIDNYEFMIQKKGEQIFPYLNRLLEKGRREEARKALYDLCKLISHRYQLGISDQDAVIHKNSGFRGGRAMFLDVGGFSKVSSKDPGSETVKITAKLQEWLREKDPQLARFFEGVMEQQEIGRRFPTKMHGENLPH